MASWPRRLRPFAVSIALSAIVFAGMQLFDGFHCFDCGAQVGFPLSYLQDGTYATRGHFLWLGFLGDAAIAATLSTLVVWMCGRRKILK